MNSTGLKDLVPDTRISGMSAHKQHLDGVLEEPLFSEGFKSLDFNELDETVTKLDAAYTKNLSSAAQKMALVYAMAVARDAKYAHSGRKFMMAVGANDVYRGLYEGGKLHFDHAME